MTDPQYVNNLANIYTEMYNPASKEKPLTEAHNQDHDYDMPRWKRLLHKEAQREKFYRGPRAPHKEEPVKVEEDAEEHSTAKLAIKYIRMLIDEAETDASAAAALADIRDIVKYG